MFRPPFQGRVPRPNRGKGAGSPRGAVETPIPRKELPVDYAARRALTWEPPACPGRRA